MSLFLEMAKRETGARKTNDGDDDGTKKYKNNFVLSDAIEESLKKMIKDAHNDTSKRIPPGFDEFARCQ